MEIPVQLLTIVSQIDALPASDLKAHLQARHRTLYEDNMGPVFVVVEDENITSQDYAFISGDNGLLGDGDVSSPQYYRPYQNVSYLSELHLYEALYLANGEDGYWIMIPESIVEHHPDLKWVLTADEQGGLSDPQPLY
jgi:hypothetical protein